MMLRLAAMALSAVQVKTGYPRVREAVGGTYGQGRQSFYFYRHANAYHWFLFQVSLQHINAL
jgi:hypothetical protein